MIRDSIASAVRDTAFRKGIRETGTVPESTKAIVLDGMDGTFVSTPDSVANSVSGDITVIAWIQWDDYSNASQTILSKWVVSGDQRSYKFEITENFGSGQLRFWISDDGIDNPLAVSNIGIFTDGVGTWVRVSWADSTNAINIYTSADPLTTAYPSITWSSVGFNTVLTSTGIFDSSSEVQIGADESAEVPTGSIGRTIVIASADPTAAAVNDMNPSLDYVSGSTFISSSTGETYTLQGNAVVADI